MEKEVALAASIQRDLFPAVLPQLSGCDIGAQNRQARQVGGDYYDVLPIQGARAESASSVVRGGYFVVFR